MFSLTAPEERHRSEPGEFLNQEEKPHCAQGGLRTQASWAPAPLHSHVTLGKSTAPFMPQSQPENCRYNNTSLLRLLFMYVKCIEIMPDGVNTYYNHHHHYSYYYLLSLSCLDRRANASPSTRVFLSQKTILFASNISNVKYPFKRLGITMNGSHLLSLLSKYPRFLQAAVSAWWQIQECLCRFSSLHMFWKQAL